MKKLNLISILLFSLVFSISGCSKKVDSNISQEITVGKEIKPFTLNDQFEKPHTLTKDTKQIIFVFTKATGHSTREYFNTKPVDYLEKHHTVFVADVSGMPSIIYSMFAKSDLQKHKYPIWLIFDENISAKFKDPKNEDKIMVVSLDNFKVTNVEFFKDDKELAEKFN